MSGDGLAGTLDLLRRVLALEQRQGYRNTAAMGGLYRYFQDHFGKHEYDAATWVAVDGVLHALKRYEAMGTVAERHTQTEILLRRITELEGDRPGQAQREVPIGPVSPAHRGDAPELARVRASGDRRQATGDRRQAAGDRSEGLTPQPPLREAEDGRRKAEEQAPGVGCQGLAPAVAPSTPVAPLRAASAARVPGGHGAGRLSSVACHLEQPLSEVLKMRPQEVEKLERLGVRTVEDALYHLPRDHYDCRNPVPIHKLRLGVTTTVVGTLQAVNAHRTPRGMTIVEARITDATGVIRVSWFNQQHLVRLLRSHVGGRIAVSGHTELYNGRLQLAPRDYEFPDEDELTHTGRLVPIYPLTEGLTQRWLRGIIKRALDAALHLVEDPLPEWLRREHDLPLLGEALRAYHFPADKAEKAVAVHRLAFDELLYIGIGMARRKRAWQQSAPARPIPRDAQTLARFEASLPFALTGAQKRALDAILDDVSRPVPMNRLLQGDVGSGKTVVAAGALLMATHAGLQGAIMAPTEILAEQHYRSITGLLEPFGVEVALLTGAVKGSERKRVYAGAAGGEIAVLVGTHALIQEGVEFDRLGLAVVDEQHRFGVEQRAQLRQKGFNPHVLALTATPIPRTLSLTIYGDLDVSVVDERPPGRQPVETSWVPADATAYRLVREQVALGRQAYVICPLVEDNASSDARAAVAEQKRLQRDVFPDLEVGLLHGKMKSAEKEASLARFRDGAIQVLVATSVVEVGIDVPNATVMVVQEADRFGLAQLHQFRGRVGRGAERSYCLLLAGSASAVGQQRLQAILSTDDGFKLAEEDLRLRGPGEFWGTRQSGLPELKVAGLGDTRAIEEARDAARRLVAADPDLAQPEHRVLARKVVQFWSRGNEMS